MDKKQNLEDLEPTAKEIRAINAELIKIQSIELTFEAYQSDSVKQYLLEVNKYQLLSFEEEQKLGRLISNGDDEAKDTLFKHNMRLVVNIAKQYLYQGAEFLDLIQEGNVGLLKAIDKWDYAKGNKFSTYAFYWIKQEILRYLENNSQAIRVPSYMQTKIREIKRLESEYFDLYEEKPSDSDLAAYSEKYTEEEIKVIKSYINSYVSLSTPIDEDGETTLGDLVSSDDYTRNQDAINEETAIEQVDNAFSQLKEKEALAVKYFFGYGVEKQLSCKEIAPILGVSSEMARQYKDRGVAKLKHILGSQFNI